MQYLIILVLLAIYVMTEWDFFGPLFKGQPTPNDYVIQNNPPTAEMLKLMENKDPDNAYGRISLN